MTNAASVGEKIDSYIDRHEKWKEGLSALRAIANSTDLEEVVRWGAPSYTLDGKIIVGIVGFKNHFALWFYQGVFLEDTAGNLVNAQEGVTKAMRQWRFESTADIDEALVRAYIAEAIENQRQGKTVKPEAKSLQIPQELSSALAADSTLRDEFDKLSPGKQREYAEHIGSAKQEKTRLGRMEKARVLIAAGVGLHDKYRR